MIGADRRTNGEKPHADTSRRMKKYNAVCMNVYAPSKQGVPFTLNKGRNGRTNGSYMLPPPFPKRSRSVQACRRFRLMSRGDYHVEISFHEQLSPKRLMSSGRTCALSGVSYVCPRMEKATGGDNQTVPFGMESIKAFPSQRIVRLFAAETAHPEEPPSSPASFSHRRRPPCRRAQGVPHTFRGPCPYTG